MYMCTNTIKTRLRAHAGHFPYLTLSAATRPTTLSPRFAVKRWRNNYPVQLADATQVLMIAAAFEAAGLVWNDLKPEVPHPPAQKQIFAPPSPGSD